MPNVDRRFINPQTGLPEQSIRYHDTRSPEYQERVAAHETAHPIKWTAGYIPTDDLEDELRNIYSTLTRGGASNATDDGSINWAEEQSPSSVNDSARAMMARLSEYRDDHDRRIRRCLHSRDQ